MGNTLERDIQCRNYYLVIKVLLKNPKMPGEDSQPNTEENAIDILLLIFKAFWNFL